MELFVTGHLNEIGEKFFSVYQLSGVLDVSSVNLYISMRNKKIPREYFTKKLKLESQQTRSYFTESMAEKFVELFYEFFKKHPYLNRRKKDHLQKSVINIFKNMESEKSHVYTKEEKNEFLIENNLILKSTIEKIVKNILTENMPS